MSLDLQEILPEELFDDVKGKPIINLSEYYLSDYKSNCPELLGDFRMVLYIGDDENYYVCRTEQEPIGDYGTQWVDYWYICNDNNKLEKLLNQHRNI